MSDDESAPPPKKLRLTRTGPPGLSRFVEAGRSQGALLAGGLHLGTEPGQAHIADARAQLEQVEQKLARSNALWQREWAVMMLRGLTRALSAFAGEPAADRLLARCDTLRTELRARDEAELGPIRARFEAGAYSPEDLKRDLSSRPRFEWDAFVERILGIDEVPEPEKRRAEDMVHYLASPFEVILELAGELKASDVLYDLGCGLAKVTMLLAWLTPVRAKGVEFEPAYAMHAEKRAQALRITRAEVLLADAREVDYSDGTAFYFYDPFRGEILAAVLAKLEALSRERAISVFSRGKSNEVMDGVAWLRREKTFPTQLAVYRSRTGAE